MTRPEDFESVAAGGSHIRTIVEITVAETINRLQHEYGVGGLDEGFGTPTIEEIAAGIVDKYFSYMKSVAPKDALSRMIDFGVENDLF